MREFGFKNSLSIFAVKNFQQADLPQNLGLHTCFQSGSDISMGQYALGTSEDKVPSTAPQRQPLLCWLGWGAMGGHGHPMLSVWRLTSSHRTLQRAPCRVLCSWCHHVTVAISWVGGTAHPHCVTSSPREGSHLGIVVSWSSRFGAGGSFAADMHTYFQIFLCLLNSWPCCLPGYLGHCQYACSCRLATQNF